MPIRTAEITITGVAPLLTNNPQAADRFNHFARAMKRINDKKSRRTDDDYRELRELEIRTKSYFDDEIGLYIPATWIHAALTKNAYRICRVGKADIRAAVFATEPKIALQCQDRDKVKSLDDIVGNPDFCHVMIVPVKTGGDRKPMAYPIFHNWSFNTRLEFDDKIIDPGSLVQTTEYAAKYGGFGDFRPSFGRAYAEVTCE